MHVQGVSSRNFLRDSTVDIARGAAAGMMTIAHYASSVLTDEQKRSIWIRLAGSFAAPLFIAMSGMMVGRSISRGHTCHYFLHRGISLICISSILLEVLIFGILPLASMDVLCLIGMSLPLTAFIHKWPVSCRCVLIFLVFAITPALQRYFDYREDLDVWGFVDLEGWSDVSFYLLNEMPKRMFIDGSFPFFPWVGYALAGSVFATWRWESNTEFPHRVTPIKLWVGTAIALLGACVWYQFPGPLFFRGDFCEMFYPPTTGYSITAFGVVVTVVSFIDRITANQGIHRLSPLYQTLTMLGRCSLLIYLVQYALIYHVIVPMIRNAHITFGTQIAFFIFMSSVCLVAAALANRLKHSWKSMPFMVRFLLGS